MEKKVTSASTVAEQKAIIRDCLEKTAYIRQTMARLFPRITLNGNPGYTPSEDCALNIHEDYTVSMSNALADIYGHLIGKEVSHE
ncbi:MAG: hypothetical protein ACLU6Z_12325 [Odoribacter splanchnicus]|jgi:hypothetical protein|nr:hypothetical protein [Odoribacter splanchnicus]DAV10440.1 MAG TPA: hypothetical protein [Caudoviricetes sp.]